jgi:NAD+ diphosphatase
MAFEPPRHCSHCGGALAPVAEKPGQRLCTAPDCARIAYLSPIPVVAAIVERDGKVILVRGHGWPATWYGLVTGFLEPEESPEEAARREVAEELGLVVETSRLIGAYPFARMNQVIIAYHLRARGEIVLEAAELEGFKEVPLDQLRPWDFGTGAAVKDFLALRRAEGEAAVVMRAPTGS